MEIVFVVPEVIPFAQTGGLAEVCGVLTHEIAKFGHSVSVFLPKYKSVDDNQYSLEVSLEPLHIPLGSDVETGRVLSCKLQQVNFYFIEEPHFFQRDGLYGTPMGDYPDNDRRFTFFCRGVLEALKKIKIKPDVLHCHDWQTGLISAYLKTLYRSDPFFQDTKSVFTIHNLAYQGNFPPDSISTTGLSWNEFRFDRLEFYGKISFLKGGLVYSDVLTTVSERYAQEIQSKAFGCGMEGVLGIRKNDLRGILNGIDTAIWDPAHDSDIAAAYDADSIEKKTACKTALQSENKLRVDPKAPLFGFVGRLAEQKGIDLIEPVLERMAGLGWQLVLLGSGEEQYHERFRRLAEKYPGTFGLNLLFDLRMSKRIYAGADMFLMPSQFEPCGLGQMISMRYGTIPVVREVGGLSDTVHEFNPRTGEGNGFVFLDYTADALFETMQRAVRVYEDSNLWMRLVSNAMSEDFSWETSARKYIGIYERIEKKPLGV